MLDSNRLTGGRKSGFLALQLRVEAFKDGVDTGGYPAEQHNLEIKAEEFERFLGLLP